MTDQKKDEICAKALGWEVHPRSTAFYCEKGNHSSCKVAISDWQPGKNAGQSMMLLEWLTDKCNLEISIKIKSKNVIRLWYKKRGFQAIHLSEKTIQQAIRSAVVAEMENMNA